MSWFKILAIGAGILIAFLVVGSVMHFIITAVTYLVIAALVAGGVASVRCASPITTSTAGSCRGPTSSPSLPRTRRSRPAPRSPHPPPRTWRMNSPGSSGRWAAEPYQFASASLVTAA